jgi:hypothetical protein
VQREALELVKKRNAAGFDSVLDKARRVIGTGGARVKKRNKSDDKPAPSKFDLATLVYTVDTWSMDMVKAYNPVTEARAMAYLHTHLPGAIEKLISLAEANGLAGDVLDAYVARRMAALRAAQEAAQDELASGQQDGNLEPAEGSGADDPDADLRQRLRDFMDAHHGGRSTASVAGRIGIGAGTLKVFLEGDRIYAKTRTAIEAYLTA